MPTRVERNLEMALGRINHQRRRSRIKHAQEREAEADRVKAAQLDIAAVPVGRVRTPPLTDALSTVRLADVLAPINGVGDQIDAGWQVLRSLILCGVTVRYHGDFDWPGVLITSRVLSAGGVPWRMGADDYATAAGSGPFEPLEGARRATPWDEQLSRVMEQTNAAVHEEALVDMLLGDLLA